MVVGESCSWYMSLSCNSALIVFLTFFVLFSVFFPISKIKNIDPQSVTKNTKKLCRKGRFVLVSAATPSQVENFKLALVCTTPKPFEVLTFNEFEIVVGDHPQNDQKISLAQAMAQPALNRCGYCATELLVPNRCRGCKLVSFCNKNCQVRFYLFLSLTLPHTY